MKRLSGRRVPPANSVPQGVRPVMPSRPGRGGRVARRRRNRPFVIAGATAAATVPLALIVTPYLMILTAVLLGVMMALYQLRIARESAHTTSQARKPMIQDLLKELFGTPAAAAPAPAVEQRPEVVAPSIAVPEPAPPAPRASEHPRLPTVAKPTMIAIEGKIERILETLGKVDLGDMTQRETTDLRDVHLPALIASYVDIPADHRALIFKEKGKSASYVLKDSLDVIAERLDGTIARLAKREISSFDDANRFITDRYGNREDPFA